MKAVYTTVEDEYESIRQSCGLVEYEGLGTLRVSGPSAARFLSQVCTRSVDFLLEGQILTALMLGDDGAVVAEGVIHCQKAEYVIEVWPAQREAAVGHLAAAAERYEGVTFEDVSGSVSVFGIEGPESFRIAQQFLPFSVASMAYRSFVTTTWRDVALTISRTGVTGEYGYKLKVPPVASDELRDALVGLGTRPCGLEALDICRMEMRFVNLEREGGERPFTPFDVALQWMVDFNHEFDGRDAVVAAWENGGRRHPACWMASDSTETVPEQGAPLAIGALEVGHVTHAVWSPRLGRAIGTAAVDQEVAASGLEFALVGSGRRAKTVSAPFVVATSFGVPLE